MAHDIQLLGARQILDEWESEHIAELIDTIERGLKDESDTTIDAAKCLIEAVCKTILTERGGDIGRTDSPGTLIRKTTRILEISDEDGGETLQQMIRGMTGAINGLESMRDAFGPLAHGRDADHNKLGDWHRLMAVRTAEAIAVILFEAHACRTTNLRHTRASFDENDPANKQIDQQSDIQVDQDTYEVVINETYRFRPSQILYDLDRAGYLNERGRSIPLPEEETKDKK